MDMNRVYEIELSKIYKDENMNCRDTINPVSVVGLAKDIEKNGLDSPVLVQVFNKERAGKFYEYRLLAGYRRYTAHQIIKKDKIRCLIKEVKDEKEARLLNLRENIIRENLNMLEEARSIEYLIHEYLTDKEIAKEFGKSPQWVNVRVKLLSLPKEIQQEAAAGILSASNVLEISKLPSKDLQYEATKKLKDAKLKGQKTGGIIKAKKKENPNVKRHRKRNEVFAMMFLIQDAISNNFGTRCLAWAAGEISDEALYLDIQEEADKLGKSFEIPELSAISLYGDKV